MAVAELLAGLPGAISENIARDTKTAAEFQDAKIKERDWRRQRETQFILSKYSNERGELTPEGAQAAMQHAARADLLPEVQKAIEERTTTALQSQIDAHQNRMLLESMGVRPSLVSLPTSDPQRVQAPPETPDPGGFMTPEMKQPYAPSQATSSAPVDGTVRIVATPQVEDPAMQERYEPSKGTYWSDAMREQPRDVSAGSAGVAAGDFEPGGAKYKSFKGKDPGAVAAARLQVQQNLGIDPGASVEDVEAAYNRLRKALYEPAVAGQMPLTAFYDPKTRRIDIAAYEKHKADIRTKAAEAGAKLETMNAEQVKQRRAEQLEEQAAGIALTGAKNAATDKNAEREAVGGMISNVNPIAKSIYGVELDPAKINTAKDAQEIADRIGAAGKAYEFIQKPGVLEGSWNKVLTDMMTLKGSLQTMDKIAGTESGERTLINMLYPDMDLKAMYKMGWLDHGGITEKGLTALATQFTNVGADEVRRNVSNMIRHSATLTGAMEKYKAGKDGPKNYAYASPKAADATFSTGTALAGGKPAEPAKEPEKAPAKESGKMTPGEGKAEKERRFQEEKKRKAAKGPKAWTSRPDGTEKVGDTYKGHTLKADGKWH